jgi:hypothetical protein|tara:strand:+ start:281 stop:517 length:237 start_codon:yes stop_codon:yes gene_type:complete
MHMMLDQCVFFFDLSFCQYKVLLPYQEISTIFQDDYVHAKHAQNNLMVPVMWLWHTAPLLQHLTRGSEALYQHTWRVA